MGKLLSLDGANVLVMEEALKETNCLLRTQKYATRTAFKTADKSAC